MKSLFTLKDKKGRIILQGNKKGQIALSRFPDLSELEKKNIVEIYSEIVSDEKLPIEELDSLLSFLNFQDNEKFCS